MAVSPLKLAEERARQSATGDDKYFRKFLYFFELRVPQDHAVQNITTFFFPLVINPESYTFDEPFTVEATPTQGGGLYVEENGIVQRTIRLRGHTGFKPRLSVNDAVTSLATLPAEKKSFTRQLPSTIVDRLSGHRNFQYLQDSVFRVYADFKRDPATSEGTSLIFHNPKDDEHWWVVPQRFTLERDKADRVLYHYNIELLVVDKADALTLTISEDKSLLDNLKDSVRQIKRGIDTVSGALQDLTAMANELTLAVKDFGKIVDSVTNIVDSASNFVDGVVDLVESPYAILNSTIGLIDSVGEFRQTVEDAVEDISELPDNVRQKFRQMGDGIEMIGQHPEAFETPAQQKFRNLKARQDLIRGTSNASLEESEAAGSPSTVNAAANLGTAITPGDIQSALATLAVGSGVNEFTGTREVTVRQGDTLPNLAARFYGDARLWQHIAIVNSLRPPYISASASAGMAGGDETTLPGTLGIGSKILIPNFTKPPQEQPLLPVLGVTQDEPSENHLLGTDLAFEPVGGGVGGSSRDLYDIPVDSLRGSTDVKKVAGVPNISQAIITRLLTERGHDILYKNLGVQRIIGLNFDPVDLEDVRFRIIEAVQQDPRVALAKNIIFEQDEDKLIVEIDAELRGFTQSVNIRAAV